jgi:Rap1a immunity proteins
MKMRLMMLASGMLVGLSAPALALTGNELLAECEQLERAWVIQGKDVQIRTGGGIDHIAVGRCWGYLQAYFEIAYIHLVNSEDPNAAPTRPLNACPPNGVSLTQFIRMFLQKARNNPAQLHQPAFFTLANLLTENFPCSR